MQLMAYGGHSGQQRPREDAEQLERAGFHIEPLEPRISVSSGSLTWRSGFEPDFAHVCVVIVGTGGQPTSKRLAEQFHGTNATGSVITLAEVARFLGQPSQTNEAEELRATAPLVAAQVVTVREQLSDVRSWLGLSMVDTAYVMHVERQTVYEWFDGREPHPNTRDRLNEIYNVAQLWQKEGEPLPKSYLRVRLPQGGALLELLAAETLDKRAIREAIAILQDKFALDRNKRLRDELRRREHGFRKPDLEESSQRLRRISSAATDERDE